MNPTMSFGDGPDAGAGESENKFCKGVDVPFRARENVCLNEAKLPGFGDCIRFGGGEGDRLRVPSAAVTLLLAGEGIGVPFTFFLLAPKERRNDHSDSN